MPLIGCLDLLLADIDQASARFASSSDEKLRNWLNDYPGDNLEAICVFCKNWLENDVLVGYSDIDLKEVNLDSWFEDRQIQEFIEKLEKKSNKNSIKINLQSQQIKQESETSNTQENNSTSNNIEERRLPFPGGIKQIYEKFDIQEDNLNEEILKNKPIEVYKLLIEKIAELKFSFGEFLNDKKIFSRSPYLIYLYAFLILFTFGIGIGFLRNNLKNQIQENVIADKTSIVGDKNKGKQKNIIQEFKEYL